MRLRSTAVGGISGEADTHDHQNHDSEKGKAARWVAAALGAVLLLTPLGVYGWLQRVEVADGKAHVRYMAWGTPEQQAIERKIIGDFEGEHPGIVVDYMPMPYGEYFQKLQIMLASRTEADVSRVDLFYFPAYVGMGYFEPLNDLMDHDRSFSLDDFVPQAVEEMRVNGKQYGLDTLFGGKMIYYNKTLFEKAGLKDPYQEFLEGNWTLETFLKDAKALTKTDEKGRLTQVGCLLTNDDIWAFVWDFGGDVLSLDGKIRIDEPASVEGLRFFSDLMLKHHVIPLPSESALSVYQLESGNVAMVSGYSGESPRYRKAIDADPTLRWDIVPMPAGPKGRFTIFKGNALVMSARTKQKEAAWELVKYLTSEKVEEELYGDTLRRASPTRKKALVSEAFEPKRAPFNAQTYLDVYVSGRHLPVTDRWNDWNPAFVRWMERLMSDDPKIRVSPEEAAGGMRRDMESILGGEKY